jgi:hypothetical protein
VLKVSGIRIRTHNPRVVGSSPKSAIKDEISLAEIIKEDNSVHLHRVVFFCDPDEFRSRVPPHDDRSDQTLPIQPLPEWNMGFELSKDALNGVRSGAVLGGGPQVIAFGPNAVI